METKAVIILSCILVFTLISQAKILEKKNVIVIVDVKNNEDNVVQRMVSEILDSISLIKYRIALYSTNGLSQPLLKFQSRKCSRKTILRNINNTEDISKTLEKVKHEIHGNFRKDRNIILVITSRKHKHLRSLLNEIGLLTQNYIIQFDRLKGGSIKHVLSKSVNLKTWRHSMQKTNTFPILIKEIFNWLHFSQASLHTCNVESKQIVYDECRRHCECKDGRLVNCYRLREQFSALSLTQRKHYIEVYKEATSNKRYQRYFYSLLLVHPKVNFEKVHSNPELFPFHRKFILLMENLFRLIDCSTTIPYWNFPLQGKHVFQPSPGYHMWDNNGGFGSTKTSVKNGFCLQTGPFRYPLYKLPTFFVKKLRHEERLGTLCENEEDDNEDQCERTIKHTYKPNCITRGVENVEKFQSYNEVYRKLHSKKTTFKKLQEYVSQDCHAVIHDNMGGDFGFGYSSLLPEFFLLHSFIDAMWDFWQKMRTNPNKDWLVDKRKKILNFHTPRYWYVDNNNLEECGVKIKYTNIFPKPVKKHLSAYSKNGEGDDDDGEYDRENDNHYGENYGEDHYHHGEDDGEVDNDDEDNDREEKDYSENENDDDKKIDF